MKLTDDEKRLGIAACSTAIANTRSAVMSWRLKNLRTKFERALRDGTDLPDDVLTQVVEETPPG